MPDATQAPRVAIAADHAGVEIKALLVAYIAALGYDVRDLGPHETTPVDYPSFAHRLASEIARGDAEWGVLICGSGIGMSIAANKVAGARAALVHEGYTARMARQHNDANIIVLGARVLGIEIMKECIRTFAETTFTPGDDGRHQRRRDALEPR
jgi:ribose 5-phosphate isomerase B